MTPRPRAGLQDPLDVRPDRSYHPGMPMWRCPHCGARQAETARCWVCRRSSTTCSTCRHFRRAVAGGIGYCGLDRRRLPLTGLELRGCWSAVEAIARTPTTEIAMVRPGQAPDLAARAGTRRGFVPLDELVRTPAAEVAVAVATVRDRRVGRSVRAARTPTAEITRASAPGPAGDRATLFGELER